MGSQSDIATHWLDMILYVPLKMHIRSGGRYAVDDVSQDNWGQTCLSQLHIRRVVGYSKAVTNQVFRVGRGLCNNLFEAAAESPPVSSHTVCGLNALQVRKDEFVACCKTPQRRCLIYVTYILYRLKYIQSFFPFFESHFKNV